MLNMLIYDWSYSTPWFYLPAYIQQKCGASPALGSLISAVLNIGMICGRIGIGAIADTKIGISKYNCSTLSLVLLTHPTNSKCRCCSHGTFRRGTASDLGTSRVKYCGCFCFRCTLRILWWRLHRSTSSGVSTYLRRGQAVSITL